MAQKNDFSSNDILSLLSPERRAEILNEVLGTEVRSLVDRLQGSTFGGLVAALTGHAHWGLIRGVAVASLFRASATAAPAAAPSAPAPVVAKPVREPRAAKAPKRTGGRPSKITDALLDQIHAFVKANPGLRSEEIQKRLGGDKEQIKASLAKLKSQNRVVTGGAKRGTTYTAS